jgi:hypothetical protein
MNTSDSNASNASTHTRTTSTTAAGNGPAAHRKHTIRTGALAAAIAAILLAPAAWADVCRGSYAPGTGPTAASDAFGCGALAAAIGEHSTALGNLRFASAKADTAVGNTSEASGANSFAA